MPFYKKYKNFTRKLETAIQSEFALLFRTIGIHADGLDPTERTVGWWRSFISEYALQRGLRSSRQVTSLSLLHRHCPDSRRTFTKRLMLEKHIQLMHGIKDPDLKEMTEATNEEETEIKEDTKVKHCRCSLYSDVVLTCSFHSLSSFKFF